MFAVDPGHAAMAMAHVFAKTNVRDRDDLGTFLFYRAQRFLNDTVFGISATRLFVFFLGNTEKKNGLKAGVLRLPRLIDNFVNGELENARHTRDRAAFVDLFADEKRENEIVGGQIRFANKISERGGASQTPRAMNQFSHATRLRVRLNSRKPMARNFLLIDISNSFTKLAFATPQRISKPTRIETPKFTSSLLRRIVKNHKIDMIVVCSVVPKKNAVVRAAGKTSRIVWLTPQTKLGVGIDYPNPKTIGADRLANAAAVAALYGCPAIVVDFGTAVTFDIISAQRKYIGGVIAPGLESMTNFLYQRTALLPKLSLKEPRSAVGRSTMEAMRAGAVIGYRGLVREIIARIKSERFSRQRVHVVATGGYAELIAKRLGKIDSVHPNLTLEGLRIAANLNP